MSKTAKNAISMQISGQFLGVKIHTGNRDVYNTIRYMNRKINYKARNLLAELRPLFTKRIKVAVKVGLKTRLRRGYVSLGLKGTYDLESEAHGTHKPHKQIRYPLSRIVDKGTSYQVVTKGASFGVNIRVHRSRNGYMNFHNKMKRVPRISTVWNRLDATCLPFVSGGYQADIYEEWLESLSKDLMGLLSDHLQGKRASRDAVT